VQSALVPKASHHAVIIVTCIGPPQGVSPAVELFAVFDVSLSVDNGIVELSVILFGGSFRLIVSLLHEN